MTDEELKNWEKSDSDINDELHNHFSTWGRWDWTEIAGEALRVHNVMFGDDIEDDSPIDAVTTAAIAHADHMAYEAMAAAIGVNATHLRCTVARWSENQDKLPAPVSVERLLDMIKETRAELEK